jgi:hypothetical protein
MSHGELNNDVDVIDVQASGSNISCDQNVLTFRLSVPAHHILTLRLTQISVKGHKLGVCLLFELLSFHLGVREDQNFKSPILGDEISDHFVLLRFGIAQNADVLNSVRDLVRISADQINQQRRLHFFTCDLLNVLWHRSREDHRLSVRHRSLKALNILAEAHIKHLISLVEYLVFAFGQVKSVVLTEINESAWSCDNDLWLPSSNLRHYIKFLDVEWETYFILRLCHLHHTLKQISTS